MLVFMVLLKCHCQKNLCLIDYEKILLCGWIIFMPLPQNIGGKMQYVGQSSISPAALVCPAALVSPAALVCPAGCCLSVH